MIFFIFDVKSILQDLKTAIVILLSKNVIIYMFISSIHVLGSRIFYDIECARILSL